MNHHTATLWQLYTAFLKIGGFTFGGGYAMLPILQREVITNHGWVTEEEVLDIYAIGQCTPGIIAVNTATMIGYRTRGVLGAIVATLGEVTPSLVIISLLSTLLVHLQDSIWVQRAFGGIRVAVCALVVQSIISLSKKSLIDIPTILLYLATITATLLLKLSPLWIIPLSILFGLSVQAGKRRKR
ncbi:MAG: chromate transporter [Sphaerochaeta sp.]|jgi:chromate transporter|uniref:chromate transporter n=1 Tax=Sphaerochaeta sp. TaxID=1972642 RepID=UPI002FCB8A1D